MENRYKTLGSISIVKEPKSYEKFDELTGGFNDSDLKDYIKKYGHSAMLEKLAYMTWTVWETVREINNENQGDTQAN